MRTVSRPPRHSDPGTLPLPDSRGQDRGKVQVRSEEEVKDRSEVWERGEVQIRSGQRYERAKLKYR